MRAWGAKPETRPVTRVVEAHTQANEHVGPVHHHVAPVHAVHPQHPQTLGMVAGKTAEAKEGVDYRDAGSLGQLAEFLVGPGMDDAVPGDDYGALGFVNQRRRLVDVFQHFGQQRGRRGPGSISVRIFKLDLFQLHVPGHVDQDRARPALLGHAKSLANGAGQVGGGQHQVGALGADGRDAANVAFLERLRAQRGAGHLAGDGDHGDAVGLGAHDPGNQVGRAGAGSGYADAGLAGNAGVAVGGVGRGLFVPHQDMTQLWIGPQRVVERQNGSAGVSKEHLHTLAEQTFTDDF